MGQGETGQRGRQIDSVRKKYKSMHKGSETIEFKKSTAEVKSGVVSIAAMLNKHGRGEQNE